MFTITNAKGLSVEQAETVTSARRMVDYLNRTDAANAPHLMLAVVAAAPVVVVPGNHEGFKAYFARLW